jgi:hypothetical protein
MTGATSVHCATNANHFVHVFIIHVRQSCGIRFPKKRKKGEYEDNFSYPGFQSHWIVCLVAFGSGRSEAYYRAAAAGCGPNACAAAAAGGGRYTGYRARAVAVGRY